MCVQGFTKELQNGKLLVSILQMMYSRHMLTLTRSCLSQTGTSSCLTLAPQHTPRLQARRDYNVTWAHPAPTPLPLF